VGDRLVTVCQHAVPVEGAGELWFDERGGMPNLDAPTTFDQNIHDITNPIITPYLVGKRVPGTSQQAGLPRRSKRRLPPAAKHSSLALSRRSTASGWHAAVRAKEYSVVTWKSEQQVRSRMSHAGTIWLLLSLLAFAAGIVAILISLS